jgi:hypothetical protein
MSEFNPQSALFPLVWINVNQNLYGSFQDYHIQWITGDPERPKFLKSIPIFSRLQKLRENKLGEWAVSTILARYRERGGSFGEPDFWLLEDCIFSMEDFLENNDPLNGGSFSRAKQLAVKLNRIRNSVWA